MPSTAAAAATAASAPPPPPPRRPAGEEKAGRYAEVGRHLDAWTELVRKTVALLGQVRRVIAILGSVVALALGAAAGIGALTTADGIQVTTPGGAVEIDLLGPSRHP